MEAPISNINGQTVQIRGIMTKKKCRHTSKTSTNLCSNACPYAQAQRWERVRAQFHNSKNVVQVVGRSRYCKNNESVTTTVFLLKVVTPKTMFFHGLIFTTDTCGNLFKTASRGGYFYKN